MLHISLAAESIAHIGSFPITNSLALTWVVMALLIGIGIAVKKNIRLVPSYGQSIAESIIDGLYSFFESIIGHQTKAVFPVIASLFLFIIVSNWIGLLPGIGTVGFYHTEKQATVIAEQSSEKQVTQQTSSVSETPVEEATEAKPEFIPLFRGPTADLNTTIALAIIAFVAIQYFGFKTLGIHYGKRFINFKNPIMFFVGILEIISDISKMISFSFRLFGNIFAGEVLLSVMAFLMPFLAPMPFLMLELFVGFIQALVFSTLTAVFINVAAAHEG